MSSWGCSSGRGCAKATTAAAPKFLLTVLVALAQTRSSLTLYSALSGYYYDNSEYGTTQYGDYDKDDGYYSGSRDYEDYVVEEQNKPAEAVTSRFQYVVSIGVAGSIACAGWMYRDDLVVTAAHCLPEPLDLTSLEVHVKRYVLLLSENWDPSKTYGVTRAVQHPQYDASTLRHDVAVLLLDGAASDTHDIFTALPANSRDLEDIENKQHRYCTSGCELSVIGWGQLALQQSLPMSSHMQRGIANLKALQECNDQYSNVREVSTDMVCTISDSTADSCACSDGAPLVLPASGGDKDIIVGVVSWGGGCTNPGQPIVHASMQDAKPFIEQMSLDLARM